MPTMKYKSNQNEDTAYCDGHKVQLIAVPAGTLQKPIHATSDAGYVVDGNGNKHRVLMAVFLSGTPDYKPNETSDTAYLTVNGQKVKVRLASKENGTLTLSDSANVNKGYAVGTDGEKHRVLLVNTPSGTLELPNSETDDSAYVIDNGKKTKVRMFVLINGAGIEVVVGPAVSPLSLPDAVANSLSYVKAYGGLEQNGTPTPTSPVNIVCNNGTLKVKDSELPVGYKRLTGITYDANTYYETNEKLYGSDTLTIRLSNTKTAGQNVIGAYSGTGDDARNFSLYIYGNGSTSNSYLRHGTKLGRPRYGTGTRTLVMGPSGTDGFLTDVTYDAEDFETTDTFRIGALPNSSSPRYDGNIIGNITVSNRLKYIPCERVSDGEIGYYETFTGVFLENQGSGTPVSMGYDTSYMTEVYADGTVETVSVIPNERENHFVQYINAYLKGSTRSIVAYNGNSVVTFDCEVGKTYCCINRAMSGSSTTVNIGYSDTIPTTGYVYAKNDFEATIIVDGSYKTTGLVFTAKKRYATFIFRYDNDSSQNPTSMLEQMIFYETSKAQSATCEPLLAVGDYTDVQSILDGVITRNVGIKIFDGTEDWTAHTVAGTYRYRLDGKLLEKSLFFSTHFVYSSATSTGLANGEMMCGAASPNIYVCKTDTVSLDDFKAWLAAQYNAGTPVIVIYPLAEPTTESVTGQTLQVQTGDNTLEITQASLNNLELEAKYMKEE